MVQLPNYPKIQFTESNQMPYPSYEHDVSVVLDSVVSLYSKYFNAVDAHPLQVINAHPNSDYPMAVYESNTIYLCVQPDTFWAQFIYQFSHEFCHYMNFGHVVQPMRWFEEVLCELASHFFLIESAVQWSTLAPHTNWSSFAPNLLSYELNSRTDIESFELKELSDPDSSCLSMLEENEYLRKRNRYIALELLPIFMNSPTLWKIVPHLPKLNSAYLADNIQLLGELSGQDISEILVLFGFTL